MQAHETIDNIMRQYKKNLRKNKAKAVLRLSLGLVMSDFVIDLKSLHTVL